MRKLIISLLLVIVFAVINCSYPLIDAEYVDEEGGYYLITEGVARVPPDTNILKCKKVGHKLICVRQKIKMK